MNRDASMPSPRTAPATAHDTVMRDYEQRLARALAMEPELLVADEPVSALDVSVQAQVLKLFAEVRERFQLAMVFITHDLRVAGEMCDHIAVMQRGQIVEYGETAKVLANPQHAYTRTLIEAQPRLSAAAAEAVAA